MTRADHLSYVVMCALFVTLVLLVTFTLSYVAVASLGQFIGLLVVALAVYAHDQYQRMIRNRAQRVRVSVFVGSALGATVGFFNVFPGALHVFQ